MGKIFWGLIFVLLDFNVGRFDIIPDFVGYVLIALGIGELMKHGYRSLEREQKLTYVMIVISLAIYPISAGSGRIQTGLMNIINLVMLILSIMIIWGIISWVLDAEQLTGRNFRGAHLQNRYRLVVILMGITYVAGLAALVMPIFMGVIVVIAAIIGFIAYILFLVAFYQTKELYQDFRRRG